MVRSNAAGRLQRWRHWRRNERQQQADRRHRKQQRRIAKLRIGGARNHLADVGQGLVGPDASHALGETQPDRPHLFQFRCQRAIVDQRITNAGDAACPIERLRADKDAAAGSGGHA